MEQLSLLGVEVDIFTISELNHLIVTAIHSNHKIIVAHHNLHSVYLYHHDIRMQKFYNKADVIHIDGMPLVWWGKLLGYPLRKDQRVTYVDWINPLMALAQAEKLRVFYLGGKPGVAERAAEILRKQYPSLQIQTRHGYFSSDENEAVLRSINAFEPHILMVGMGMPRQEHWVLDNLNEINANAILTSGACFDYVAGEIPTPPRWMGRMGLEWLYRLFSEPRRLARRYLIEPWALLPLAVNDLFWNRYAHKNERHNE